MTKAENAPKGVLQSRDWPALGRAFRDSAPWKALVIDDLLEPTVLGVVREQLVSHWNWRFKDWSNDHLRNMRPNIPLVRQIGNEFLESCDWLKAGGYELTDSWALMQTRSAHRGSPHWDRSGVTLSIWLTDDEYNCDEDSGGLLVYDVTYGHDDPVTASPDALRDIIRDRSTGRLLRIPYRANRATILDSRVIHRTDDYQWRILGPSSHRINLAFSYNTSDQLLDYERRAQSEQERA